MDYKQRIFIGRGAKRSLLELALANRHGLIAGATGFRGALVSMLEGKGVPSVVERILLRPPSSGGR
jgi:hypothetical protein